MCDFPLYDTINREIPDKLDDFTIDEKEKFLLNFKKLKTESVHELIYVLIRVHENSSSKLPYNSKEIKAGYKFDLDSLPIRLKYILQKFINIELKKNKEDH